MGTTRSYFTMKKYRDFPCCCCFYFFFFTNRLRRAHFYVVLLVQTVNSVFFLNKIFSSSHVNVEFRRNISSSLSFETLRANIPRMYQCCCSLSFIFKISVSLVVKNLTKLVFIIEYFLQTQKKIIY